ncbi:amino acid adenylation domain-containing protein [Streptomyces megasporus]|uniref:amino acid adenylation domain-containing protein n=1 Tax=Streptomyces megasporus TaxID=44060 RepID=UPI000691F082|nr:amino acid adenylation domain-containing protein [Streptomyces megasporus]
MVDRNTVPARSGGEAADFVTAFERWAARQPGSPAVTGENRTWTYGELNSAADRVAGQLRALGVGRESRVAVLAGRTPEMLSALLGILKAGGAYVPLDPAYPHARLAYMLEDSGAAAVLAERRHAGTLAHGVRELVLEELTAPGAEVSTPAAEEVLDGQLAYVIYTSGSTGRPKGVLVSRATATEFVSAMTALLGPVAGGTMVATCPTSFDLSVCDIFVPLCSGGHVMLAPDVFALCEKDSWVRGDSVCAVPSALAQVVALGGPPPGVTSVLAGGEAMPIGLLRDLHKAGVTRVFNVYGPTETTVCATAVLLDPDDEAVSIGLPLHAVRTYVLDERLRPVPDGTPGELFIGGAQVTRGYHGRPGLTAERFLPDPFDPRPGARMYRTGDRVSRRPSSGLLDYHGRLDSQVKLRGFRIEPGEIENVLTSHPGVVHAAAVVRDDLPGGPRLVAYTTPAGPSAPTQEELRAHLRSRLPEHMVPSQFVTMDALPLTPIGKLDRSALPAPARRRSRTEVLQKN